MARLVPSPASRADRDAAEVDVRRALVEAAGGRSLTPPVVVWEQAADGLEVVAAVARTI